MKYKIKSLNVALPQIVKEEEGTLTTGFLKHPANDAVYLSKVNFDGDGQADLEHHGGPDKAVCVYPYEHYSYWSKHYNHEFTVPSFGENITIEGLNEKNAGIGDIFKLGEAVVQVTQPRQPCYKIAKVHGFPDMPAKIVETGFSGFYLRVLEEGKVSPEDSLELIEKCNQDITISFVNQIKYHDQANLEAMQQIIETPGLAENVRASFLNKLTRS